MYFQTLVNALLVLSMSLIVFIVWFFIVLFLVVYITFLYDMVNVAVTSQVLHIKILSHS